MPQQVKQKLDPEALQGVSASASEPEALRELLELAFDYRGDVTIVHRDERGEHASLECFIYDRQELDNPATGKVRVLPKDGGGRLTIPIADIEELRISGRDAAAGKSWQTWVKKYVKKKLDEQTCQQLNTDGGQT